MRAKEFVSEKWSKKYKSSINCARPRGFSQKAHCAGRKKNEDLAEFAPGAGGDDEPHFDPETYYDIPKLKKVYKQLASRSVNSGWYDLQLTRLISAMEDLYLIDSDALDELFPTAPEIANYIERNIIKAFPSEEPPYIVKNPDYKPRAPRTPGVAEEQLDELQFKGSECTKDCSGHAAGYEWSQRKGLRHGNSPYSPSFNKGAALAVAGL